VSSVERGNEGDSFSFKRQQKRKEKYRTLEPVMNKLSPNKARLEQEVKEARRESFTSYGKINKDLQLHLLCYKILLERAYLRFVLYYHDGVDGEL
jgi:hypothetical protein